MNTAFTKLAATLQQITAHAPQPASAPAVTTAPSVPATLPAAPPVQSFATTQPGPLAAVDCSLHRLGETADGILVALRAALLVETAGQSHAILVRTGPLFLSSTKEREVLYHLGAAMGQPDYYVTLDRTDPQRPQPLAVKRGVTTQRSHYGDRVRACVERLVQQAAVAEIQNGSVLVDGALTLRSRDTPDLFLRHLAQQAGIHGNALIGISKTSELVVQDRPVRYWLDDKPYEACYRSLTSLLQQNSQSGRRAERVLGQVYAARFSPLGPTFRVDVKPAPGQSFEEAIHLMVASARMDAGYPDVLVRAHALCCFSQGELAALMAQARMQHGLALQPEVSLTSIFAPFAGRFK